VRIKRLQLAGFKSCMERTTLDFPTGITGIVGPNGCGKSNIVDALRWVLGEQSAKQLRGQVMEDVIFVGNERYSPLGVAEVTITLDNDEPIPTVVAESESAEGDGKAEVSPLLSMLQEAAEIEVTRRLYRSGESEYLINSRPCRLRDITELFLGTGVGTKAYSIIEQGRVGQIVNAKPEELRLFIEEAAGTTLYRARKLSAERKIERTRNNLLRVSDILAELERQAGSLRRQVRGAVRYKELRQQEERLDRHWTGLRLKTVTDRLNDLQARLRRHRDLEEEVREAARAATASRDEARLRESQALTGADDARKTYYEKRGHLTAVIQERQFLEQRVRELAVTSSSMDAELKALDEKVSSVAADTIATTNELQAVQSRMQDASRARQRCDAGLSESEDALSRFVAELDSAREHSVETMASAARIENELSSLVRQRDVVSARLSKLKEEDTSLGTVTQQLMDQIDQARARLDDVVVEIGTTSGGKEAAAKRLSELLGQRADAERLVEQRRSDVAALGSRFESLRELSDSFAGYDEGVRAVMQRAGASPLGATAAVVADVVDIEQGYERAAAAVLADRLQFVVVGDAEEGVRGAEFLRGREAGRASFLPLEPRSDAASRRGDAPSGCTWMRDHVHVRQGYEKAVDFLLADVVVASDLRAAVREWTSAAAALSFVTVEGDVIEANGIVSGGSGKPGDEAILSRKAELRGIRIKLVDAEVKSREARAAFDRAMRAAEEAGSGLSELDRKLHELTIARVAAEGACEIHRQNLLRTEDRQRAVATEIESLMREEVALAAQIAATRSRLAKVADDRIVGEQRIRALTEQRQALEHERDRMRAELATERVRDAELAQKAQALVQRLRSFESASADLLERRRVNEERRDRDTAELHVARERLADPSLIVEALEAAVARAQSALEAAEAAVTTARTESSGFEKTLDALSARMESLREERARLELAVRESELERDSLHEGLRERFGDDADRGPAEGWGDGVDMAMPPLDVDSALAELENVRAAIRRLGVVNVGAVAELEEIDRRLEELGAQKADLERSMEDLRGTIGRLNRLSRQRFKDTFDRVNEIFQRTFPRLFQGGKAWLALTDESNLLETGVEIFVHPPGKKLGNINLMSGGEKALTAVSLIFSLFLHKPSPFCVLDEVDAPLDDANIGRFARMVLEMSERSQFLLITHNKKTMESCNTLYGVTMREPGVSKIVSVEMSH
jgi:chromosome segregation protein